MNCFLTILLSLFWGSPGAQQDSIQSMPVPQSLKKLVEQVIKQAAQPSKDIEIEIDGLLVDESKTKAGKDFYDFFYGNWQPPERAKNYSILITEKPFQLISTQMVVTINENIVYQTIIQPRQEIVEALAGEAITYAQNFLANYEEIMKELNGDDMAGTGIY